MRFPTVRGLASSPVLQPQALGLRLGLGLVAIIAAYHFSLSTLLSTLSLDTPLAYLGLVPLMALGLAAARGRRRAGEPEINDRQVDYIVGLPLLAISLGMLLVLPGRLSTLYWVYRLDILSLPLFVAAVVTLLFGVRVTWRLRFPIAFLLLAWPVPYNYLVDRWLEKATAVTLFVLNQALHVLPFATPQAGGDGSLFTVGTGASAFSVSVASSCAGVNGVVGFLLVGIAFTALVRGRRLPKFLWLFIGLSLIYLVNVARLLLIFWAGKHFGQGVAIDGLHPFIGLVLFTAGVVAMLKTMPLFRLSIDAPAARAAVGAPAVAVVQARPDGARPYASAPYVADTVLVGDEDTPALVPAAAAAATTASAPARPRWRDRLAVPVPGARGLKLAGGLVVVSALLLSVANSGLSRYGLVAGKLGSARLASFLDSPAEVNGFNVAKVARYEWATRFFGGGSTWDRYVYSPGYSSTSLRTNATPTLPVIADVVSTSQLRSFSTYGIAACYQFHGYDIKATHHLDLGGGVTGDMITYRNPRQDADWNALYWVWPVVEAGHATRYERVVLLQSTQGSYVSTPSADLSKSRHAISTGGDASLAPEVVASQKQLEGFGRTLVQGRDATPTRQTASGSTAGR